MIASLHASHESNLIIEVLVIYDWLLTFSDEIRLIWRLRLTGAKLLFVLNRYIFLAASLAAFGALLGHVVSIKACASCVKSYHFNHRG